METGSFTKGMTGRKKGEGRVSPPLAFPSSPSAELKRFPSTMIINEWRQLGDDWGRVRVYAAAVVVSGSQKGNNLRVMALALIGPFDITAVSQ